MVLKGLNAYRIIPKQYVKKARFLWIISSILIILAIYWRPLGSTANYFSGFIFVLVITTVVLGTLFTLAGITKLYIALVVGQYP